MHPYRLFSGKLCHFSEKQKEKNIYGYLICFIRVEKAVFIIGVHMGLLSIFCVRTRTCVQFVSRWAYRKTFIDVLSLLTKSWHVEKRTREKNNCPPPLPEYTHSSLVRFLRDKKRKLWILIKRNFILMIVFPFTSSDFSFGALDVVIISLFPPYFL